MYRRGSCCSASDSIQNVFVELTKSGCDTLRLLPISGGIFQGPFAEEMPDMTMEAIIKACDQLDSQQMTYIRNAQGIHLCIYMEDEYGRYLNARSSSRHFVTKLVDPPAYPDPIEQAQKSGLPCLLRGPNGWYDPKNPSVIVSPPVPWNTERANSLIQCEGKWYDPEDPDGEVREMTENDEILT